MMSRRHRRRVTERDLAGLADGSLTPDAEQRVDRALAESPELRDQLNHQRYAVEAVRATEEVHAPAALRARVALAGPVRRPRRTRFTLAAAAASVAVTAVAVVLTLGGTPAAAPTVADAAVLAKRPPVAAVPEAEDDAAALPGPRAAGLRFPYWEDHFGWKTIGARRDRFQGRATTTVFYRRHHRTVAYTIVSGPPLHVGADSRSAIRRGTTLHTFTADGRRVVTWLRHGHTCLLSSAGAGDPALHRLAAWRGGGALAY
jgi:hypothetical protein